MKKVVADSIISDELIAAYLDGNATAQETQLILGALAEDAELRELLRISHDVDIELGQMPVTLETLPLALMAANPVGRTCGTSFTLAEGPLPIV